VTVNRTVSVEAAFGSDPFDDLAAVTWTSLGRVQEANLQFGRISEFEDYDAGGGLMSIRPLPVGVSVWLLWVNERLWLVGR
jgi:hypothetical protein